MGSSLLEVSSNRIFAIGDIHGCPDEVLYLLSHLEVNEGLSEEDTVVFLGDYIDRGPNSKEVVDVLIQCRLRYPKTLFLKGNHEDMLLDFLGFGGRLGQAFLYNGGLETILSYGLSVFDPPQKIIESLPEDHLRFYRELNSIVMSGDFLFVHAGLHPLRDLTAQNDGDIFWIRDDFILNAHPFQKTVLFGHTPHSEVYAHLPYKVGIDTGLVFGNKLTCMELPSGLVYQIKRGTSEVVTTQFSFPSEMKTA